jgi:hypothetical protein
LAGVPSLANQVKLTVMNVKNNIVQMFSQLDP